MKTKPPLEMLFYWIGMFWPKKNNIGKSVEKSMTCCSLFATQWLRLGSKSCVLIRKYLSLLCSLVTAICFAFKAFSVSEYVQSIKYHSWVQVLQILYCTGNVKPLEITCIRSKIINSTVKAVWLIFVWLVYEFLSKLHLIHNTSSLCQSCIL